MADRSRRKRALLPTPCPRVDTGAGRAGAAGIRSGIVYERLLRGPRIHGELWVSTGSSKGGARPLSLPPSAGVETKPGAQAQADWLQKKIYIHELGGETKISAFIMTLSHSRMWSVVWSRSENMLTWLACHNRAFEFLGGVPYTVRIDNLKTGVACGCGALGKAQRRVRLLREADGFRHRPPQGQDTQGQGQGGT